MSKQKHRNQKSIISQVIESPWRAINEVKMILTSPIIRIIAKINSVSIGSHSKFYGRPVFQRWRGSTITIGSNFVDRNNFDANPLGINHPTIFATRSNKAKIIIGDGVGISGGSICAATSIVIGDNTLIGSNCDIMDTDFHPINPTKRRKDPNAGVSRPIVIGKNVFIGTSSIILKGVTIGDNSVVAAGSVVSKCIPSNSIYIAGRIRKNEK